MESQYKGYIAKILYSGEADSFYGEVLNSPDLIVFQASDPEGVIQAMHIAVDQYLRYIACKPHPTEALMEIEYEK